MSEDTNIDNKLALVVKWFQNERPKDKLKIIKILRELGNPSLSSLNEPTVKRIIWYCKHLKIDTSRKWDLSAFEKILSSKQKLTFSS